MYFKYSECTNKYDGDQKIMRIYFTFEYNFIKIK